MQSKIKIGILLAAIYLASQVIAVKVCCAAPPTTGPAIPAGMTAEQWDYYCQGWTGAGGMVIPPPPPILSPLERWRNQVHVIPGPYVANNIDLTPILNAAKGGTVVSLTPYGKYFTSGTTNILAQVYFNGSELNAGQSNGSGANLTLGPGSLVNGVHITHGYTCFKQIGRGAMVHNFYIDDYKEITPGHGLSGTWLGVKNRAFESTLVDVDQSPNFDVQTGWIGVTQSQNFYFTDNLKCFNVDFWGTPFEYDARSEVTGPTNSNRCQKGSFDACAFHLFPTNGKGTTVGIRIGAGLTFTNCWIEGNVYCGENPPSPPPSATTYVDGCAFINCKFIAKGTREPIDSNDGVTMSVTGCEFWTDQAKICIAIAPSKSVCPSVGNIVHVPPGAPYKQFTNSASQPGTGTIVSTVPYTVPVPPTPF